MTTAYLGLPPDTTVEAATARLSEGASYLRVSHYVYVVDKENVLQGVVSIRSLFTAQSHQPLNEIWTQTLISVTPEASYEEVLETFKKYKLQALPVLDKGRHLKGVISFQSVLDISLKKMR